jgi:radical SAM protein with 4Fe4S-binding SPASM domain
MHCGYCYHADPSKLPFTKGYMDLNTARLIIADAASWKVPSIKLNYRGESTLHPDFKQITKFVKDHADSKTFIERLTNSNFNFKNGSEDIFEGLCSQTKVKISFDSFIPEVLEKQRAGAKFDRIVKNIDDFYNHKKRKNTEIVIQAVRTKLNVDEDIAYKAGKRWPMATVSIRDMVGGRVDTDLSIYENKTRDTKNRKSCIQAHSRLIFDWQGNAQMCCVDLKSKFKLGNIADKTIYELFNSEKAKQIRESLLNKKAFNFDPCKTCSSFESYKGYFPPWNS